MSSDAVTRVSVEIAGSEISFETGRMAKQASGAVVVRQGDTMVSATAVAGSLRDVDFLPLTVDVEERMYATGKIPGSFFKREGRPGEKATLTARMIDRPLRPLFPKDWRYDTQLVAIPLSIDHVHPYDILAMNGASAALMISDIPFADTRRSGPHRQGRRQLRRQPQARRTCSPSDVRGGLRPRPDRRRHRGRDPDGRGRRQRDPRGRDPRRPRHRARRDQEAVRAPARARREGRQGEESLRRDRRRRARCSRRSAPRTAPRSTTPRRWRTSSSARTPRRPSRRRSSSSTPRRRPRAPSEEQLLSAKRAPRGGPARVRQAREVDHPRAHRRAQEAPRRSRRERDPRHHDRGRASRRARTDRRCSRAARRRR